MDSQQGLGGSIGGAPSLLQALAAQAPMMAIGQALGGQGPTAGGLLGLAMQMDAQRVKDAYTMAKDRREEERLNLAQQTAARQADTEARKAENDRLGHNASMYKIYADLYNNSHDPDVRTSMINGMSQQLEAMGQPPIPDSMRQRMALVRPDDKVRKDILIDVMTAAKANGGSVDPQTYGMIAQRYGVAPDEVQWMGGLAKNPLAVKTMLGVTDEEVDDAAAKRLDEQAQRQQQANDRKAKALGIDLKILPDVMSFFRNASGGKNILDLDVNDPNAPQLVAAAVKGAEQMALGRERNKLELEQGFKKEMAKFSSDLAEGRADQRMRAQVELQAQREEGKPLTGGTWFNLKTQTLETPTAAQFRANPQEWRQGTAEQANRFVQLGVATPMIDQMKYLVSELLKEKSPDNLINALSGQANKVLRNNPKWTQLNQLITESNIELARALGGTQVRMYLLETIKREANIKDRDTREVANSVLDNIDTSVKNSRLSAVYGGDVSKLNAYKKPMSREEYAAARKAGLTDEQITARGWLVPGPLAR